MSGYGVLGVVKFVVTDGNTHEDQVTDLIGRAKKKMSEVFAKNDNFLSALVEAQGFSKLVVVEAVQKLRDEGWGVILGHDLAGSVVNWWFHVEFKTR